MKELIEQKPYLLWLLFVLLFLQFIVMPTLSWQDEKVTELQLVKKRLAKAEVLLANEERIDKMLTQLQGVDWNYQDIFFPQQSETSFQLAQQEKIEKLAKANNLKVTSVGWKNFAKTSTELITVYELQLRFSGKVKDMMAFQMKVEQMKEMIPVVGMSVNIKQHLKVTMGRAKGVFRLQYFMVNKADDK